MPPLVVGLPSYLTASKGIGLARERERKKKFSTPPPPLIRGQRLEGSISPNGDLSFPTFLGGRWVGGGVAPFAHVLLSIFLSLLREKMEKKRHGLIWNKKKTEGEFRVSFFSPLPTPSHPPWRDQKFSSSTQTPVLYGQ